MSDFEGLYWFALIAGVLVAGLWALMGFIGGDL